MPPWPPCLQPTLTTARRATVFSRTRCLSSTPASPTYEQVTPMCPVARKLFHAMMSPVRRSVWAWRCHLICAGATRGGAIVGRCGGRRGGRVRLHKGQDPCTAPQRRGCGERQVLVQGQGLRRWPLQRNQWPSSWAHGNEQSRVILLSWSRSVPTPSSGLSLPFSCCCKHI